MKKLHSSTRDHRVQIYNNSFDIGIPNFFRRGWKSGTFEERVKNRLEEMEWEKRQELRFNPPDLSVV